MSILDQLLGTNDSGLSANTYEDLVGLSFVLSSHQAMQDGIKNATGDLTDDRPEFGDIGAINVAKTLELAEDYRRIIIQDQLAEPSRRPTSDDVVDGGIKEGSKVVFEIVSDKSSTSWDQIVQSRVKEGGVPSGVFFDKFSVLNIVENDAERYQIHETFGAEVIQSFGRRPRIITMSGQIVNGKVSVNFFGETRSMDWKNAFQRQYIKHFSLESCLKNKKKVRIVAQDTIWRGYLLNMVAATDAQNQGISQVTVRFVISDRGYAKENDEQIAGFINSRGFRITGRNVLSEAFPQSRLEFYYKNDFSRLFQGYIDSLNQQLDVLKQKIIKEAVLDGNVFDENASENPGYTLLGEGVRLNDLVMFSDLEASVIDLFGRLSDLQSDKQGYADDNNSIYLDGDDVVGDDSDSAVFTAIKQTEALYYNMAAGLKLRVNKTNELCERYLSIRNEKNQLESMRS